MKIRNPSRSRTVGVPATILVAITAAHANAGIVAFENPPGPGHYDWAPPEGDLTHWLDVTMPASAQPSGGVGVPSSFRQEISGGTGSILADVGTAGIQRGGIHPAFAWDSGFGEQIPAEPPLPPDYSWGEGSIFVFHPALGSNFPDGEAAYLGVRFDLDGGGDEWQYGWIGVVRTGAGLDAFAWGYETEPGVPICAGATAEDPACAGGGSAGDMNDDGVVDLADVEPFVEVLLGHSVPPNIIPDRADMNGDGDQDGQDIQGFVEALVP